MEIGKLPPFSWKMIKKNQFKFGWKIKKISMKKKTHAAAEFGAVKVVRIRQLGPLQMRIRKQTDSSLVGK